ncbi:hypothetical protein SmJEL517_g02381 [Synchytrium microbalum]|uniref:Rho-GAP domain-containing protein n=1 Tax=Synchytrium microbalum TaxID=1806994 RepID=A0A507C721_9FUNG|nr:uncharacterized protein SmJEL517_g02381 [Synchytrium microbalum]TPX35138.1 hypothetical protein SmJEL517_g02381 [Synchytrium microbalum]
METFQLGVSQTFAVNPDDSNSPQTSPEYTLRLSVGDQQLNYSVGSLETLQPLLVELKKFMAIAEQKHYGALGKSHEWRRHYLPGDNTPTISKPPTRNPFINDDKSAVTDTKAIKEAWIARELRSKAESFTSFTPINVFVGTYNVNGRIVTESLAPWLNTDCDPDILVIGLQEMDLTTEAHMLLTDSTKDSLWTKAVVDGLGEKGGQYSKVASKQLVGMLIIMLARFDKMFANKGNKGATAVRFRIRDSYFCFVNAHLAADASMTDRRNADYAHISKRLGFALPADVSGYSNWCNLHPWVSSMTDSVPGVVSSSGPGKSLLSIFDADHLVWFGDLNYRLTVNDTDARTLVADKAWSELMKGDQLSAERRSRRAFGSYEEAAINFDPTFKYDVGSSTFDSSEKKRAPAWCDRILWYRNPLHSATFKDWISCTSYKSCMDLTQSDHKPVSATFSMQVRTVDRPQYEFVHGEVVRELDKLENDSIPELRLEEGHDKVFFGSIEFAVPVVRTILFTNVGKVSAKFTFVAKPGEVYYAKSWMRITPVSSSIMPGESVSIELTMAVDALTSPGLNSGKDQLDDFLILHVERGADFFLQVSGEWMPSNFGLNLATIGRITSSVRQIGVEGIKLLTDTNQAADESIQKETQIGGAATIQSLVPQPIRKLVEFLQRCGWLYAKELFHDAGHPLVARYIRECLDSGVDFDVEALSTEMSPADIRSSSPSPVQDDLAEQEISKVDNHQQQFDQDVKPPHAPRSYGIRASVLSVADTLLLLLRSLPNPVLPDVLWKTVLQDGYKDMDSARRVLASLQAQYPYEHATWVYLLSFLRTLVAARGDSTPSDIADIFAPILIRTSTQNRGSLSSNSNDNSNTTSISSPRNTLSVAKSTMIGIWNSWSSASAASTSSTSDADKSLTSKKSMETLREVVVSAVEMNSRRRQFVIYCLTEGIEALEMESLVDLVSA